MVFEKIDKNSWNRKEYFDHYFASVPCTYSMTVKVDITQIKEKGMKLYPAMLYYIAMIVNRHSEFRTAINQDGELGIYDEMIPSYTIFHNDTETFSSLWTCRHTASLWQGPGSAERPNTPRARSLRAVPPGGAPAA